MEKEQIMKNIEILDFIIEIQTVMKAYDYKTFESGAGVLRAVNLLVKNKVVNLNNPTEHDERIRKAERERIYKLIASTSVH